MKFLCDNCKAKYQIGDEKVAGKAVRMKCRRCGHDIHVSAIEGAASTDGSSVVTDRSSVAPPPVATPAPTGSAGAPRARPRSSGADDDESTAIMTVPMRAPTGAGRVPASAGPLPSGGAGIAPPGRHSSVAGASSGAFSPAGLRSPSSAGVQRPVVALRSGAAGSVNTAGALAARGAGAPRPGVATHPPGSAPIAPVSPRGPAAFGREMLGEDWYVGVGGVPLGPVPVAVIRDKALAGLVDGESLVWRDGFEEWKALKNFPELLELITSAEALRSPSATSSKPDPSADPPVWRPRAEPPVDRAGSQDPIPVSPVRAGRASSPVIAPMSVAAAPSATASPLPAVSPRPSAPRAAERSTSGSAASFTAVSPVLSSPAARPPSSPQIPIDVLADPFTLMAPKLVPPDAPPTNIPQTSGPSLPIAEVTVGLPTVTKGTSDLDLDEPVRVKRSHGLPALAYAFIAMAAAFGGVAAWVLLSKPQQITYVPSPPQPTLVVSVAPSSDPPVPTTEIEVGVPTTDASGPVVRQRPVGSSIPSPRATPSGTAAPFDTSGFISTVPGPSPNGPSTAQSGSGTLSPGEIQGVIAQNQPLIKRKCWQPALDARTPGAPANARVTVTVVIGPSGNVESASAGGGESFPGLASCIASRVKGWKFSPSSSSTPANIPFVFAGQ